MTRLRNTAAASAAQWKMWLIRVFLVMYSTAVCGAQNVPNVTATPFSLTSFEPTSMEASTVSEPPVPSLQLQSDWLDVFPSEKVELRCNISDSSDWEIVWHKDEQEPDADPNLTFSADRSILTITAAAQMYSGSYFCKGQHKTSRILTPPSNSLNVTVYQNKPKATLTQRPNFKKMFPGESVTFTCLVDVPSRWEYQWYHNGNEIQAPDTIHSIDHSKSGEYYCKAKRGKGQFYTEPSETTSLLVSDPPTPTLKLLSPWLDVFINESVEFACEVDDSDWTYSWYINQSKVVMDPDEDESYFNITSVTQTDQGEYACRAHLESRSVTSGFSDTSTLKVYENTPEPTLSKVPDFTPMYVGETVNLICTVNVSSDWNYQWYKNGGRISSATGKTFSLPLSLSDGGNYSCKATRGETTSTSQSAEMQLAVHEIPVPHLENMTQWLDVFPSEGVKFSCGMQRGSGWTYTWYKTGEMVKADDAVSFDPDGSTLSISSASAKHEGPYMCRGHLQDRSVSSHNSSKLTLTVYAKKPSVVLTQDPEYKVMFPGESVSFSCHINVSSGWEFLHYKNHLQLSHAGIKYAFNATGPSDGGSYTCQVKRGRNQVFSSNPSQAILLDVKEERPKPVMTQEPKADKVYVGESVSLECKVEISTGWEYLWNKDGVALPNKSHTLKILDANSSDSGSYECTAKREKSTYQTLHSLKRSLKISEIPVPQLKQMTHWLDVFPSESVKLSCGMEEGTSDWTYTWYRDQQKVQADVSFISDTQTLLIGSAAAKHAGRYSCSGKLKSRPVDSTSSSGLTLSVYDTKPRVTLMQTPEYDVMHTEDSVSFSCHLNVSSGWEYLWYKDGTPLSKSGNNHNISSVVTKDTGSYTCQVKRGVGVIFQSDQSHAVELKILERPKANILLLTDWSEVFSTDSLVLRCEVQASNDKWNYTWFREGNEIDLPTSERHLVTPQDDPKQSLYTCRGVRTGQPSYSKYSDSFKTRNLLLKRRVLLSISGCLFFGLIAVLLGCIVLRFVRKPAVDDDKPEEENLFLTMAQLKDRSDAPDPLVEYITDEDMTALSKEADENGTLPITTQEGQALTTESDDTEENKAGLVSFKQ